MLATPAAIAWQTDRNIAATSRTVGGVLVTPPRILIRAAILFSDQGPKPFKIFAGRRKDGPTVPRSRLFINVGNTRRDCMANRSEHLHDVPNRRGHPCDAPSNLHPRKRSFFRSRTKPFRNLRAVARTAPTSSEVAVCLSMLAIPAAIAWQTDRNISTTSRTVGGVLATPRQILIREAILFSDQGPKPFKILRAVARTAPTSSKVAVCLSMLAIPAAIAWQTGRNISTTSRTVGGVLATPRRILIREAIRSKHQRLAYYLSTLNFAYRGRVASGCIGSDTSRRTGTFSVIVPVRGGSSGSVSTTVPTKRTTVGSILPSPS